MMIKSDTAELKQLHLMPVPRGPVSLYSRPLMMHATPSSSSMATTGQAHPSRRACSPVTNLMHGMDGSTVYIAQLADSLEPSSKTHSSNHIVSIKTSP